MKEKIKETLRNKFIKWGLIIFGLLFLFLLIFIVPSEPRSLEESNQQEGIASNLPASISENLPEKESALDNQSIV